MNKSWNNRSPYMIDSFFQKSTTIAEDQRQNSHTPTAKANDRMNHFIQQPQKQTSANNQITLENIPLTAEQKEKLNICFNKYSTAKTIKKPPRSRLNASGIRQVVYSEPETDITLSQLQFSKLFQEAGLPLLPQTLSQLFNQVVKRKGKGVSFAELLELIQFQDGSLDDQKQYKLIFKTYDRHHKGYFDYQDYRLVCQTIAKKLTQSQIKNAFTDIDLQNNGKITYQTFAKVMAGKH